MATYTSSKIHVWLFILMAYSWCVWKCEILSLIYHALKHTSDELCDGELLS